MADNTSRVKVNVATSTAPIWFIGWLFTIGFAKLTFFKGVLALLLWPFYLGAALS
jgi:hypothetical protein